MDRIYVVMDYSRPVVAFKYRGDADDMAQAIFDGKADGEFRRVEEVLMVNDTYPFVTFRPRDVKVSDGD